MNWEYILKSDLHFDCIVEQFKVFFYLSEYGYTEINYKNSEIVRHDLLKRDDFISKTITSHNNAIDEFPSLVKKLKEIGVNNKTINKIYIDTLENKYDKN